MTTVDNITLGLGSIANKVKQGLSYSDVVCTTESGLEFGGRISFLSYTVASVSNNINRISRLFSDHIPHIAAFITGKLDGVPLPIILAYLGFATNTFKLGKEALSLYGQNRVLSIFTRHAWQGEKIRNVLKETVEKFDQQAFRQSLPQTFEKARLEKVLAAIDAGDTTALKSAEQILASWTGRNIRDILEEIKNLSRVSLERALPNWLYEDLKAKGGKDYLNDLLKKVYKGNPAATDEASKLLDEMKSYAEKKRLFHILGIVAAVVGLVSCIGFLVAWPFALTAAFLIAATLLTISIHMMQNGYIENRDGGFSFVRCIPLAIRNIPETFKSIPATVQGLFKSRVKVVRIPPQFRDLPSYLLPPALRAEQEAAFSK